MLKRVPFILAVILCIFGIASIQAGQRASEFPLGAVPDLNPGIIYEYFQVGGNNVADINGLYPTKHGVSNEVGAVTYYVDPGNPDNASVFTGSSFNIGVRTQNDSIGFRWTGYIEAPVAGTYTFFTASDDGSKIFIGSTQVVDNDGGHGIQERSGTIDLQAGKHAFTLLFKQGNGGFGIGAAWTVPGQAKAGIPNDVLYYTSRAPDLPSGAVSGPTNGVYYEYYKIAGNNVNDMFAVPPTQQGVSNAATTAFYPPTDSPPDGQSGNGSSFNIGLRDQNGDIGFRWRGYIDAPVDGIYSFYTTSDDGSVLLIGNSAVVNNDGGHGEVERTGDIPLKAGRHAFTLMFKQGNGGFGIGAAWAYPGQAKTAIPNTVLSVAAPPTVTPAGGNFNGTQLVTMTAPAGHNIYYTLDGSDPSATAATALYTGPFTINKTTTVKALYITNLFTSIPASATFTRTDTPLALRSVIASGRPREVLVFFDNGVNAGTAQTVSNYNITGGTPPTVIAATVDGSNNKFVRLTLNADLVVSTNYTLQVQNVTGVAGGGVPVGGETLPFQYYAMGSLTREFYLALGASSNAITQLTNNAKFPTFANTVDFVTAYDHPQTNPDVNDYGLRLRGFFYPASSATYTFDIASDDDGQFYFGTSDDPSSRALAINYSGASGYRQYGGTPFYDTPSALDNTKRYYTDALVKEGNGGDYLTVAAVTPATGANIANNTPGIDGSFFSPIYEPAVFTLQPVDKTQVAGSSVSLTFAAVGTGVQIQWIKNGVDIGGATNPVLTFNPALTTDSGQYSVRLTNNLGSVVSAISTLTIVDTSAAPTVTAIAPNEGPIAGGQSVTLTGTGFAFNNTSVYIGDVPCTNVVVSNATSLTCVAGAHGAGAVDVRVVVFGGQQVTAANSYTYRAPATLVSFAPLAGPQGGGQTVTITGTDFPQSLGLYVVTIAGIPATVSSVNAGGTSLSVTTGNAVTIPAPGPVVITLYGSQVLTSAANYSYLPRPTVTSLTPNFGPSAGGQTVEINGTVLQGTLTPGATVTVNGVPTAIIGTPTATLVTTTTPSGPAGGGAVQIVLTTDGGSASIAYTYVSAPSVTNVTPNFGPTLGGTNVTITGANFITGQTAVTVGGVALANAVIVNATTITGQTPPGVLGAADVVVSTFGGLQSFTAIGSFLYTNKPTANAQNVALGLNQQKPVQLTGSSPGGLALSFTITLQPSHGTLIGSAPAITYVPAQDYIGADSFAFVVDNAFQTSDPATVTLAIKPAPGFSQPPIITPNPAVAGSPVLASGSLLDGGTIEWNWGDGSSSGIGGNVLHTYSTPGNFTLTIIATSPEGLVTIQTLSVFVGAGLSTDGTGGNSPPPGVSGILVGGSGAGKAQGGAGKIVCNYAKREKTTYSGSLGTLNLPTALTQAKLIGQSGFLTLGVGAQAQVFPFTLGKNGRGKSTGLPQIELSVQKKRFKFKAQRTELTDLTEAIGGQQQVGIKKGSPVTLMVPVTLQIGTDVFLAITFQLRYQQVSGKLGKGAL